MKEDDRRALLRTLNDNEYRNVIQVVSTMPLIEMLATPKGKSQVGMSSVTNRLIYHKIKHANVKLIYPYTTSICEEQSKLHIKFLSLSPYNVLKYSFHTHKRNTNEHGCMDSIY